MLKVCSLCIEHEEISNLRGLYSSQLELSATLTRQAEGVDRGAVIDSKHIQLFAKSNLKV